MISLHDLDTIPFLASVARDDLARLTQVPGDLRLAQGEYAVHRPADPFGPNPSGPAVRDVHR
jgi:hypothetical protein